MMKFQEGKLYWVKFYDHSIGTKEEMVCEIVGWCLEDRKNSVLFTHWVVDTKDEQVKKDNVEPMSIIKSCIIRKRLIRIGQ